MHQLAPDLPVPALVRIKLTLGPADGGVVFFPPIHLFSIIDLPRDHIKIFTLHHHPHQYQYLVGDVESPLLLPPCVCIPYCQIMRLICWGTSCLFCSLLYTTFHVEKMWHMRWEYRMTVWATGWLYKPWAITHRVTQQEATYCINTGSVTGRGSHIWL